jgi:hypothetical protein
MVRTRYSTANEAFDDPVVEIHESQLNRLRRKANFAIPSGVIGLLALALVALGIVRVERMVRELNELADGRVAVMSQQVEALTQQLAERTDPEYLARVSMEANAAPIAGASNTANHALSVARRTAASLTPVTEQLALVDGQLVAMRSELGGLAEKGSAHEAKIEEVSSSVVTLRSSHGERLESLAGKVQSNQNRIDFQDRETGSMKTWTRTAAAGAVLGIGIASVHALGHGSR